MADGCRGKAPGDDCRPVIGGGGSCNAEGVCVPFSCGDGEVQAPEVCDGTAPQTCIELGDDYGRAACAADCSAIVHLPLVSSASKILGGSDLLAELPVRDYLARMSERPTVQKVNADRKRNTEELMARMQAKAAR